MFVCRRAGDERREFSRMPHKVEAIDDWAQSLYRRFRWADGGGLGVVKRTAGVCAAEVRLLCDLSGQTPSTLASYRETFTPSGAKDDPSDAEYVLDLIIRHAGLF